MCISYEMILDSWSGPYKPGECWKTVSEGKNFEGLNVIRFLLPQSEMLCKSWNKELYMDNVWYVWFAELELMVDLILIDVQLTNASEENSSVNWIGRFSIILSVRYYWTDSCVVYISWQDYQYIYYKREYKRWQNIYINSIVGTRVW